MHTLVTDPVAKMGLLWVLLSQRRNGILKACWTREFCISNAILDDFFIRSYEKGTAGYYLKILFRVSDPSLVSVCPCPYCSLFFRCCKMHDWCYTTTSCMSLEWHLPYFVPFKWKCNGASPYCSKYQLHLIVDL